MRGELAMATTGIARPPRLDIVIGLAYDVLIGIAYADVPPQPCQHWHRTETTMIVSANNYQPNVDIQVTLYKSYSTEPFLVRLTDGVTIHMSLQEAERLHLQLTGALYEYDRDYKYKVSK